MVRRTLAMLAVSILVAPSVTWAVPIKVDFTITAFSADYTDDTEQVRDSYNGYPIGTVGTGSFTFDDAVGDFFDIVDGLTAIDLQFSWLGRMWDEGNARITRLSFDPLGNLRTWEIDAWIPDYDCNLSCVSSVGGPATDFFAYESGFGAAGVLHEPDARGWMSGSIAWSSHPMTVPEPATFALFALGLLAIGVRRSTGGERTNR